MIIKAHSVKSPAPGSAVGEARFVDLGDELHARLEAARLEAARLVADAREAAEQIRREAREQGLQAARDCAQQQAGDDLARRLGTALPALERAIESMECEKARHLRHCEHQVVRLAIAIAERVIRREVSRTPDITLEWIRESLELAASSERISLHLHPTDQQTLRESLAGLLASRSGTQACDIVADPQIAPGSCLVKTEFGVIDQQFRTQLARIEEELN